MTDHSRLEKDVEKFLFLNGWITWRTHSAHIPPAEPGIPDLFALRAGQLIAIEVKAGKDRLDAKQKTWAELLVREQAIHYEVRSLDGFMEAYNERFNP